MSTSPSLHARADRVLDDALELSPDRRRDHVESACGDDDELRGLVLRLLRWAEEEEDDGDPVTGGGLSAALAGAFGKELSGELDVEELRRELETDATDGDSPSAEGDTGSSSVLRIDRIGPYDLLREIGRGGAAVVFLAHVRSAVQVDDPGDLEEASISVGEEVAIKLMRPGAAEGNLLERFRQERRILHELGNHPHIARLLSGGTDVDGRPYLVLEYVEGKPIDLCCDEDRADLDARLRLLVKVARAVDYAHGRKVIHRDVKPSNVLVGPSGEPKLLDFGISKLLDPENSTVPLTRSGTQLMTPAYATPEQLLGHPPGPTTDVYQLGLLLYILASGRFPYRFGPTAAAVAGTILDAPPRPLARALHEPDEELPLPASGGRPAQQIATDRGTRLRTLEARLRALDPIVQKALAKEPSDRHQSAAALADDLERFLAEGTSEPAGWRRWVFFWR